MIGISKLYCGQVEPSDLLRYGRKAANLPAHLLQFSQDKKPVVVWNITRKCNLSCLHCYASAVLPQNMPTQSNEVSTTQARLIIDDLAEYGVPVLLFSGGEPLMREDLPELAAYAVQKGVRAVVSSNGTLITKAKAQQLKQAGISYLGISLDGTQADHNRLRQSENAYQGAMQGIRHCQAAGLKVGLRFTLTRNNWRQVPEMFNLLRIMDIPRICFYHLVSSGRGQGMAEQALTHPETREILDLIMQETRALFSQGQIKEVLTVDNHADGPYLWMKLAGEDAERARRVYTLLEYNGGNSSGLGLACISWNGDVLPDQFWPKQATRPIHQAALQSAQLPGQTAEQDNSDRLTPSDLVLGNINQRPFSQIWQDNSLELLAKLRKKKQYIGGRCAGCRFLDVCGGNFRARAYALTGNLWASDPACYLSDQEIAGERPYI